MWLGALQPYELPLTNAWVPTPQELAALKTFKFNSAGTSIIDGTIAADPLTIREGEDHDSAIARRSLLCLAAFNGCVNLVTALITAGASLRSQRELVVGGAELAQHAPLMAAAAGGSAECISTLLAAGAELGRTDHRGRTAIYVAAERRHRDAFLVCLNAGADPHARCVMGHSAYSLYQNATNGARRSRRVAFEPSTCLSRSPSSQPRPASHLSMCVYPRILATAAWWLMETQGCWLSAGLSRPNVAQVPASAIPRTTQRPCHLVQMNRSRLRLRIRWWWRKRQWRKSISTCPWLRPWKMISSATSAVWAKSKRSTCTKTRTLMTTWSPVLTQRILSREGQLTFAQDRLDIAPRMQIMEYAAPTVRGQDEWMLLLTEAASLAEAVSLGRCASQMQ